MSYFQTIYIHVAFIFSSFSLMQPLKRLPAGALKRMKIKFLLPFTMNTKAQFRMPPNLLVETNTYDQRILTAAVVSGSIDPGGPIDSQTETATVYSSSTHISSLTPWKPRSKTLAFTKCTHYFPKHLVYLLLKLTFFFSRRPATPCSLTWAFTSQIGRPPGFLREPRINCN